MAESSNSSVVFLLLLSTVLKSAHAAVPAIFVLGDTTADVGTNNHFNETSFIAKAEFSHYGIDFPGARATGRFSNGFNTADYLARQYGFTEESQTLSGSCQSRNPSTHGECIEGCELCLRGGSGILNKTGRILALYSLGARKFGIISAPPIRCCPSQRVKNETGGCLELLNEFSQLFYSIIDVMLRKLSSEYIDMKYSLGNAFQMVADMMANPQAFNFVEVQSACCGNGTLNGNFDCSPSSNLCSNRDEYLFWDWYHPTLAAAKLAALSLYTAAPHYVSPINFSQLQYA